MALKPNRDMLAYDISYFMPTVAERGGVVVASGTPGSGIGLDASAMVVEYAASASGKVAVGLLLNDVVNNDLSKLPLNRFKDETQINGKVTLLRKGWVVTNMIEVNQGTGSMPANAYVRNSGWLTDVSGAGLPLVGRFLTRKDSDGYAKVFIDLA